MFKVVVRDAYDVITTAKFTDHYQIPRRHVYVMPEGTTSTRVLYAHRNIAETALGYGLSTSTRLHTLLWEDERGH